MHVCVGYQSATSCYAGCKQCDSGVNILVATLQSPAFVLCCCKSDVRVLGLTPEQNNTVVCNAVQCCRCCRHWAQLLT